MSDHHKEVLFGLYDDEEVLLKAVKKANEDHLDIMDVFTPFSGARVGSIARLGGEPSARIAGFVSTVLSVR